MGFTLNLGLQNEELLDPAVAAEFEQFMVSLQDQLVKQLGTVQTTFDDLYNPPRMKVFRTGGQSIPDDTETVVAFAANTLTNSMEQYDSHGMWDVSINAVNIKKPGLYMFTSQLVWSGASTAGTRSLIFNQTAGVVTMSRRWPGAQIYCLHSIPVNVPQVEIDNGHAKFSVIAYQSSGGALSLSGSSWFAVHRIAPYPAASVG